MMTKLPIPTSRRRGAGLDRRRRRRQSLLVQRATLGYLAVLLISSSSDAVCGAGEHGLADGSFRIGGQSHERSRWQNPSLIATTPSWFSDDSNPEDDSKGQSKYFVRLAVGVLLSNGDLGFIDRLTRISVEFFPRVTDQLYLGGSLQFMFPTASGTLGGFEVEKGGGGASLELGGTFFWFAPSRVPDPFVACSVGWGGFDWLFAEETPTDFPDGVDMLYVAPQVGVHWGVLSVGCRYLFTRYGLGSFEDFEDRFGHSDYLEIYLALGRRKERDRIVKW